MRNSNIYELYNREEIHDMLSPNTTFSKSQTFFNLSY